MSNPSSGTFVINPNGFFVFDENGALVTQHPTAFDTPPSGYNNNASSGPSFGCAVDHLNGYIYYNRYSTIYQISLDGRLVHSFQSACFASLAIDAQTGNVWGVNAAGITVYAPDGAVLKTLTSIPGSQIDYDDSSNAFWVVNATVISKISPAGRVICDVTVPALQINWGACAVSPAATYIQSMAIDPVGERLWVLTGTMLANYNNLVTGACIRIYDLQGMPINAFLYPVEGQTSVSSDLVLQADSMLSPQSTLGNAAAQYLVLSPQSGMAVVCSRLSNVTVDAVVHVSVLAFNHRGDFAATPVSAAAMKSTYYCPPLCAFDGIGNLWSFCSYFGPNGQYLANLYKSDRAFKNTISNTTTANAAGGTEISYPSISGNLIPFGNFTSNAALETAQETTPFIEVRAKLIQNFQADQSAAGAIAESTVYRVEILTTQNDLPRVSRLRLWSASDLRVQCRGAQVQLSPLGDPNQKPVQELVTDAHGRLTLDIAATDIEVGSIYVQADFMTGSTESIVVNPAQQVHAKLAKVTAADLQQANAQGSTLLPSNTYSPEQAEAIASAIRTVMSVASKSFNYAPQDGAGLQAFLAGQDVAEISPGILYRQSQDNNPYVPASVRASAYNAVSDRLNVSYLSSTGLQAANLLVPELKDEEAAHWSLSFSAASMRFTPMSLEGAQRAQQELRRAAGKADIFTPDFSFGDLWDTFVETGKSVAQIVVSTLTTVGTEVIADVKQIAQKIVVTLSDIANQVQEFVFRTVDQAAQFVKGIFKQVGIALDKVLDFLKSIFGWDDIVNTKKVVKHQINQLPAVLDHVISIGQLHLTTELTKAKIEIANTFKSCRQQLADMKLQSTLNEGTAGADALNNIESQWFINGLQDNAQDISSPQGGSLTNTISVTLDTVRSQIKTLIDKLGSEPGFLMAQQCFERMAKDPTQIPKLALSALISIVEGVAEAMIDLTIALINIIATVLKGIMDAIFNLLNMTIDIPLLSSLYKRFVDPAGMSMLDLVSFVLAGAATAICKAVTGKPPFTNSEVAALTGRQYPSAYIGTGFTANEAPTANPLGSGPAKLEDLPGYTAFNKVRSIFLVVGYVASMVLTSISDGVALSTSSAVAPTPAVGTPAPTLSEQIVKGTDGLVLAISLGIAGLQWDTWALGEYRLNLIDEKSPSVQPSDTDVVVYKAASIMMGATAGLSCMIDFMFIALEKRLAKQDVLGASFQSVLGVFNLGSSIAIAVVESKYKVTGWPENTVINISDSLGGVLSFVGPALQTNPQTKAVAPVAAVGIDVLFGSISIVALGIKASNTWNPSDD